MNATSRRFCIALAALAGSAIAGAPASADDIQKLPGVKGDYRIAKPAPQPEPDDALPAGQNGAFRIGDTDVKISGSVTIDVGAGAIGLPRH